MHSELKLSLALRLTRIQHTTRLCGNNGIAMRRVVLHSGGHIPYTSVRCAVRQLHRYCAVYGLGATLVSYYDERYFAGHVCTIPIWFGFGSLHAARFHTGRYSVRQGGDTSTAWYAAQWRHRYRTMMSGTVQYVSVLSQYDLASVHRARPDSVLVSTVCSQAAISVLHGMWPGGDTGIVL